MVTSTCTPGSMLMEVIWRTISDGECKSMILLWILIWERRESRGLVRCWRHSWASESWRVEGKLSNYKETWVDVYTNLSGTMTQVLLISGNVIHQRASSWLIWLQNKMPWGGNTAGDLLGSDPRSSNPHRKESYGWWCEECWWAYGLGPERTEKR
jgi:hypothetical protein